jgi:hypothetical protein
LTNPLTGLLLAGTLPGVIAGAIVRVELLAGGHAFTFIVASVLLPLGLWLMLAGQRIAPCAVARTLTAMDESVTELWARGILRTRCTTPTGSWRSTSASGRLWWCLWPGERSTLLWRQRSRRRRSRSR